MKVGILTKDPESWHSKQLEKAALKNNVRPFFVRFSEITVKIEEDKTRVYAKNIDFSEGIPALIVRPVGRGSLEEIIFRLDTLHTLERQGVLVVNPPKAIEISVDKYYSLALLKEHGIPVPRTVSTENPEEALKAFNELGGDIVVKPLFGSRGIGSTRVSNPEVATRIFRALTYHRNVLYLQKYVEHGFSDIRAFVIGDSVFAAMKREAKSWKTNVSQGAKPLPVNLGKELEDLAVNSAKIIGCRIAGVDIIESENGPLIIEINSQPGWRGLQTVTKLNIAEGIMNHIISELRK